MEWENSRESTNVEDRRGDSGRRRRLGIPIGGGTGGLGIGVILVLAVIGYFTGIDPRVLIGGAQIVMGNGGNARFLFRACALSCCDAVRSRSRKTIRCAISSRKFSARRRMSGRSRAAGAEGRQLHPRRSWCSTAARSARAAARRNRRWGRSIARTTRRSISTCRSSTTCARNTAAAAISPMPM